MKLKHAYKSIKPGKIPMASINLQEKSREIFYRYVDAVPADFGFIEEHIEASPSEVDWGDKLCLSLIPASETRCRLNIYAAVEYCQIYVGRSAEFEFDPHFDDITQCPEFLDKIMSAVVFGGVSEIIWSIGKYEIGSKTCIHLESGERLDSNVIPLRQFVYKLLPSLIKEREIKYEPYLADEVPNNK